MQQTIRHCPRCGGRTDHWREGRWIVVDQEFGPVQESGRGPHR